MMKLIKYMGVALAMTAFASCNNEDELNFSSWENDPSAVHIQAGIGKDLLARTNPGATDEADQTKFNEGDQISVAAGTQNAVVYTLAAGGTWTPAEGSYLKWKGSAMQFTAFYPTTMGTTADFFTVPTDQSTPALMAQADYMTFNDKVDRPQGTAGTSVPVSLVMQRRTARIKVNLKFNSEYKGIDLSVSELKIKGYSQISKGSSSNMANFTPYKEEGAYTYIALVAPNPTQEEKKFFISLKVNDKTLILQGLPVVEAGKSYTYNLSIRQNKVEVQSVSIIDWSYNEDLGTGEAIPVPTPDPAPQP